MRRTSKRLFSVLMSFAMVFTMIPADGFSIAAYANDPEEVIQEDLCVLGMHEYGDEVLGDEFGHYHVCNRCGNSEYYETQHSFSEWHDAVAIAVVEPDDQMANNNGQYSQEDYPATECRVCEVCGYTEYRDKFTASLSGEELFYDINGNLITYTNWDFWLFINAQGGQGDYQYEFQRLEGNEWIALIDADGVADNCPERTLSFDEAGTYTFRGVVTDSEENECATEPITITILDGEPVWAYMSIETPEEDEEANPVAYAGCVLNIWAGAEGGIGEFTYEFQVMGENGWETLTDSNGTPVSCQEYSIVPEEGTYQFRAIVTDSEGNVGVSEPDLVKVITNPNACEEHVYGDMMLYDDHHHWFECVVCGQCKDFGEHTIEEWQEVYPNSDGVADNNLPEDFQNYSTVVLYGQCTSCMHSEYKERELTATLTFNQAEEDNQDYQYGDIVWAQVSALGGNGQYTYVYKMLQNGEWSVIEDAISDVYEFPLEVAGEVAFVVEVTDGNGNTCETNIVHMNVNVEELSVYFGAEGMEEDEEGNWIGYVGYGYFLYASAEGGSWDYTFRYLMKDGEEWVPLLDENGDPATGMDYSSDFKEEGTYIFKVIVTDSLGNVAEADPITVLVVCNHEYSDRWVSDENGHWHECTICGDRKDEGEHSFGEWYMGPTTDIKIRDCIVCGYSEVRYPLSVTLDSNIEPSATAESGQSLVLTAVASEGSGDYTYTFKINSDNEWIPLVSDSEDPVYEGTVIEGQTAYCVTVTDSEGSTADAYVYIFAIPHEHEFSEGWIYDENNHWHECRCGEKKELAAHTFTEWEESAAAANMEIRHCTVCGYSERREIVTNVGWVKDEIGWRYYNEDGSNVINKWKKIDEKWYHFDEKGYMQTGWYQEGSYYYYLKKSGVMAADEWVDNDKYYIDANGHWVKGKTKEEGSWKEDANGRWYKNADGSYPKNQWKKIDEKWYHFDENGYVQTGWYIEGGVYYYLNEDGSMAVDEWVENGKYYVDANGHWVKGKTKEEGSWKENSKGKWYQNADGSYPNNQWKKIDEKWYHFDENGYVQTGWYIEGGVYYYLNEDGSMAVDEWVENGKYYVDANGHWVKGKTKEEGSWKENSKGKWYQNADGSYPKNQWKKIDGEWYHFDANGYMQTGWYEENGVYYYLKEDGSMATDEWVNNGKYYVDENGHWVKDAVKAE